jgi:cation transport ATPase
LPPSFCSALASESANAVLVAGKLEQIPDLLALGRHTLRIVHGGVRVGMSVAGVQMLLGCAGLVPPVVNACLQELVDLGTILNAARVVWFEPEGTGEA